jgi:H+/Cl- antiporter ClcA
MTEVHGKRIFRRPEKNSFHTRGRLAAMDHGIRLRSDSNGSMKSAFYQGKIVSASKNPDRTNNETENATLRHRHSKRSNNRAQAATVPHPPHPPPPPAGKPAARPHGGTGAYFSGMRHQEARPSSPGGSTLSARQSLQAQKNPVGPGSTQSLLTISDSPEPSSNRNFDPFLANNSSVLNQSTASAFSTHNRDLNSLRGTSFVNDPTSSALGKEARSPLAFPPTNRRVWSQPQPKPLTSSSHPIQHPRNSQYPNYGSSGTAILPEAPLQDPRFNPISSDLSLDSSLFEEQIDEDDITIRRTYSEQLLDWLDPSDWLSADVRFDSDGAPYFEDASKRTVAGIVRALLYNPVYPEFTSLQQFSWAVIIGIFMGVYTAAWKLLIENCVDLMWRAIPEALLRLGVFTDLDGSFPIYHYMWIVPSVFGGTLSFIFASLSTPIPGQNEWIHSLHSRGVQDFDTFGLLFLLSTAGMTSGLSLGPELPLILTAGMIGSWLAVVCKQSMLQARVLNLTAASAAIGGFFGFPMAGALFVLEVPHRMGLQYFEALTPSTIASIVAVLTNRLATGNDVTGYYEYPFLNETLPSHIFKEAIIYGLFGCALGIFYTKAILALKHFVHDLFHDVDVGRDDHNEDNGKASTNSNGLEEMLPLVGAPHQTSSLKHLSEGNFLRKLLSGKIAHEPTRAAVTGWLVGLVVGITCIFIPHVMFWGEAQLQSLIDKGRTPLPVFGSQDEPTGGLVALGFCMGNHENGSIKSGFSLGCSATIVLAKIFVTGLSLGTGIIGGHFWAPLFAGCAASHFLTDLVASVSASLGFSSSLAAYPCVALLCIMGSTHVVACKSQS